MKKQSGFNVSPAIFRRWSSKGYSVFNSLKRTIKIGCLLVTYLLFANPESISAQTETDAVTKSFVLESIDVGSDQMPETYSNMSRVVVTISKSEIERAAVSSVNELLEYAANIDIRQRGTDGMQADVSIRGGSFDQVLILLNGVNITDPQTGHHNLNLPLDLSSVERIEILKGPGAWKFGPGAFSGAINIITKTAEKSNINAEFELGQFALYTEKVSVGMKLKNTSHLVSVNHSSTDGYTNNTDHQLKNIYYQGKLVEKGNEFAIQAGATDKGFGANSFYTAKYPNQYEAMQTYFASADYKTQHKNIELEPRIYYRRNNDRFLLFRDKPAISSNYHTTDVFGANALANITLGTKAVTSVGVDFRNETIHSNNLGEETDHPIKSPVNDTITLNRFHSRSNISVFAGYKRYFNNLMVNIGANLTNNSDLEGKWFLYPGVDLNYQLNNFSSVFGSANKTMRMPTYTDLYYHGPNNEGNPDLLPEEAIGYELGYKFQDKTFNFSLTGFSVQGKNMIDWVRLTTTDKWRTVNYTKLNTSGLEIAFKVNLAEVLFNQSVLKEIKLNYTFIDQNKLESGMISNYALNYLKHRFDFDLHIAIWKNLGSSVHVVFQDRNGQYLKYTNAESAGMADYEPFVTADWKLFWKQNGWTLYASINNILDADYYDYGNVPQPGRWIKFGIGKKIEFK